VLQVRVAQVRQYVPVAVEEGDRPVADPLAEELGRLLAGRVQLAVDPPLLAQLGATMSSSIRVPSANSSVRASMTSIFRLIRDASAPVIQVITMTWTAE
jgi:hypothetical protein